VRGTTENCSSGKILLQPQSGPDWGYKTGSCDAAGRFEIAARRPGEYYAPAFPADRPVGPETTAPFLPTAVRVTVRSGVQSGTADSARFRFANKKLSRGSNPQPEGPRTAKPLQGIG
jgi:hypothetical protein